MESRFVARPKTSVQIGLVLYNKVAPPPPDCGREGAGGWGRCLLRNANTKHEGKSKLFYHRDLLSTAWLWLAWS